MVEDLECVTCMLNNVFFYFLVVAAMFIFGLLYFLMFLKSLTDPTPYNSVYLR